MTGLWKIGALQQVTSQELYTRVEPGQYLDGRLSGATINVVIITWTFFFFQQRASQILWTVNWGSTSAYSELI